MSIQRYRDDDPRSAGDIADAIEAELNNLRPTAPIVEGTQNYAFVQAMATVLAAQQEQSLWELYDAAYITDASGVELTKRARDIGVIRQDAVPATGVAEFTRSSPASQDRTVPSGTIISTGGDNPIAFRVTESATLSGPSTNTDSTEYTTTNTSYTTQTTFTIDVDYRDSVDVAAEIRIDNSSYTAELQVVDATNSTTIATYSEGTTSYVSKGADTYDTSSLSGNIDIEFQLRTSNGSGTAYLRNAETSPGGETGAKANISCTENGPIGNVGADTITVFVDQPAGVESVTNPNATGDPDFFLTDGTTPQTPGRDEEDDTSLRERALQSTAIGGAGSAQAVELALENIDEVISADVYSNRSDTTQNNVDPWHTEVRVYGGQTQDIAERLYEVMPVGSLLTLQGGANGTLDSVTLTLSDLYGDLTIEITRPTEITLEIEIDVVHEASYGGADSVKDAITEYVGGETTDARNPAGLGQGENVLVNEIENVAEDVVGVDYANVTLVDDNGDGNDDAGTDSDGVPAYLVGDSEVALANAADITVSETAR